MTAAHCLGRQPTFVFVGSDSSRDGVFLDVAGAMAHPDNQGIAGADIAIVWLDRPTPITPLPINTTAPSAEDIGTPLRFVGFGSTGTNDTGTFGIKHAGYAELTGTDELWLRYGVVGCHGDSGGPAFISRDGVEVLAGITSHGDPACVVGGFSTRVDLYADWILAKVQELDPPSCQLDGRCASECPGIDLDCAMDAALEEDATDPDRDLDEGGCRVTRHRPRDVPVAALLCLALLVRRHRGRASERGGRP